MKVDPAATPRDEGDNGGVTVYLSMGGGLVQFGAYVDTLAPGAASSDRHWHSSEDEFVYVLSGTATVIDDEGEHDLIAGDAACWQHGDPNAHHIANDTDGLCSYLIVGSRVARDICTYPDSGLRQVNDVATWAVTNAAGVVVRSGDLSSHLLNLPSVWGSAYDPAQPKPRILRASGAHWNRDENPVHPITGPGPGTYSYRLVSDLGGLTQFGAFVEELPPGSSSGHRHWHEAEDEMVYVLSGTLVLVEDREVFLQPGDAACWPAGIGIGHRLDNRSDQPARYLVIGTRHENDIIHYADHDLITHKQGTARRYLRHDGTEYRRTE